MSQRVVVFGPGPQFKGGISNFTSSLAKALKQEGAAVKLISWSQQYPAIIPRDFIDRASKKNKLEDQGIPVHYLTNYNNPLSWKKTVDAIVSFNPDKVIFQWAIAIQGLPIGWIARRIKQKLPATEILFDVHNVVQKETGSLDKRLTCYALSAADTYIMHGSLTVEEFKSLLPNIPVTLSEKGVRSSEMKTILKLYHPVYDMFTPDPDLNISKIKHELGLGRHVFLFFGFIRKYKGLHYAIEAFAKIAAKHPDASLLIVGESFWNQAAKKTISVKMKTAVFRFLKSLIIKTADQERDYNPLALIEKLEIGKQVVVINSFVPNEEVNRYFQVSDAVVNYYEYATPSGVESIAYNFSKPILATRVGHFATAIVDGKNGYLAEAADVNSMAEVMERFLKFPVAEESVKQFALSLSWKRYAQAILAIAR